MLSEGSFVIIYLVSMCGLVTWLIAQRLTTSRPEDSQMVILQLLDIAARMDESGVDDDVTFSARTFLRDQFDKHSADSPLNSTKRVQQIANDMVIASKSCVD